jgi:hypothetical protein
MPLATIWLSKIARQRRLLTRRLSRTLMGPWQPRSWTMKQNSKKLRTLSPLALGKTISHIRNHDRLELISSRFNMECVLGSPPSPREFNNAVSSGNPLPVPPGVLRPAYNAPGYITAVKKAQAVIGSGTKPSASIEIKYSQGTDVRESTFNQSAQSAGVSFNYFPWISFSASGSHENITSSVSTQADATDITITLFYDDMSLVTVNPSGSWYCPRSSRSHQQA